MERRCDGQGLTLVYGRIDDDLTTTKKLEPAGDALNLNVNKAPCFPFADPVTRH